MKRIKLCKYYLCKLLKIINKITILISVLSRTEKGHGMFFLKGHFVHRIYQKGHIEKNRVGR
jgi:hypothetical protein